MKTETLDDEDRYKEEEIIELERMENELGNDGLVEETAEDYEELEFVPLNSKKFNICFLNFHVFNCNESECIWYNNVNFWVVSAPIYSVVRAYSVKGQVARERD